jgi:hypothetical protein
MRIFGSEISKACIARSWADCESSGRTRRCLGALLQSGADAIAVAGNADQLRNGRKLMPPLGMSHLPTEPVHSGRYRKAAGVVGGRRQLCKWSRQGIGFAPPGIMSQLQRSMHIGKARPVDTGAQQDKPCFRGARRRIRFAWTGGWSAGNYWRGLWIGRACFTSCLRAAGGHR